MRSAHFPVMFLGALVVAVLWASHGQARNPVEVQESQYNTVIISRGGKYVSMLFGYNQRLYTESTANVTDPLELPVDYTRYMTVPMAYRSQTNSILEIGIGGGSTAWYLHETYPSIKISAVELDPAVVELAKKYFHIRETERLTVSVRDGRIFLYRNTGPFDVILVDAYRGPFVPFHLLTKEFFELAKRRLSEGGIIAQNIEPTTMLYDAAIATMASVFDNVDVYKASGNYVAIAYDGERKSDEELRRRAKELDVKFKPRYSLAALLSARTLPESKEAKVLTDDFAPVLMLKATERHNRRFEEQ